MTNAEPVKSSPLDDEKIQMDDLVALCRRRGFIFQASELYGGLNGFWDYGPLGTALKNNLRDAWWRDMVLAPPLGPDGKPLQIVGLDSSIIQNPRTWEASGHVGNFNDPMVDCKSSKLRYRADHVVVYKNRENGKMLAFMNGELEKAQLKKLKKLGGTDDLGQYDTALMTEVEPAKYSEIIGPDVNEAGSLTEPRAFNMMFKTYVGATATEDDVAYLRPETAQGIFLNYKNVLSTSRVKPPFGIAQIGKAFRNEVTPRNFIYRSREFEQMEMEWFCPPEEAKMWREFWLAERHNWWKSVGLSDANMILRDHDKDELSHYATEGYGTTDVEYRFPFTWPDFGELEGVAHRCAYDLTQHQKFSGTKLEYVDPQAPDDRYIPHVIEPAAGLTRGVLAVLAEAYTRDESRPAKMYMKFTPQMAPIKAAILPLVAKDGMPEIAEKLYLSLRKKYVTEIDIKQNIGKRYARHDEIGTPYCITIDTDTLSDQTVTIRHRDTMQQERIALDKVEAFLAEKLVG
jgi:glycyl-tRNA synthetase